jgi:hypothetical protein
MGWKFILELQYWFNYAVINQFVNKDGIYFPSTVDEDSLIPCSFIELLFNDNYSCDNYKYLFTRSEDSQTWPSSIRSRLMLYPTTVSFWYPSESGTNLFNLESDDITLLDTLLSYRSDSTGVTIITDTTSTYIIDTTAGITLYTNYNILSTNLSKLIFTYLDFKINQRYSRYNNRTLIASNNNVIELCYETYVLDEIFSFISSN